MPRRHKLRVVIGLLCLVSILAGALIWTVYAHRRQEQRNTALLEAVIKSDSPAVQRLLAEGADANAVSPVEGEIPLSLLDFCKQLFGLGPRKGGGMTALMHAADSDSLTIVKMLVEAGADVHARDVDGYTPLLWAAYRVEGYRGPIILFLAAHGADVNVKANDGMTAWKFALSRPETMQALKQALSKK